jgi:biopolymer transport protein ExbB
MFKNLIKIFVAIIVLVFSAITTAQTKPAASKETLLSTYQRELAFLMAQKRNLKKQKTVIEREYSKKLKRAQRNLTKAQDKLVSMTKKNELKGAQLMSAERNLENVESANSLVETTHLQGKVTLGLDDKAFSKLVTNEQKTEAIFKAALDKLKIGGLIRSEKGEFFNREGKNVQGDIYKIGRISSLGTFDGKSAQLIPVGLGKMKLGDADLTDVVSQLKSGSELKSLPLFIYESTQKGIEVKKDKTVMEMLSAGGAIAYVIAGLGIVAMILVVIRGFLLWGAGQYDKSIVTEIENVDLDVFESKLKARKTPVERVLANTLLAKDKEREARENIIHESILGELNFLDKFGAIIMVMAAVAPLLGLLGTVTGMISTFDIITEFGTGDPKLLSSGISEALITTKLGLVVAIPSLLLGNLLGGWSGKIKIMLEREALRLSNRFDKDQPHA